MKASEGNGNMHVELQNNKLKKRNKINLVFPTEEPGKMRITIQSKIMCVNTVNKNVCVTYD